MKFSEALSESFKGKIVVSHVGNYNAYSPYNLQVKKLSDTSFVSANVTTDEERKGQWRSM